MRFWRPEKFSSWRTTFLGISMILTGVGDLMVQVFSWDFDAGRVGADVMGIGTGIGFILTRDAAASRAQHREEHDVPPVDPSDPAGDPPR